MILITVLSFKKGFKCILYLNKTFEFYKTILAKVCKFVNKIYEISRLLKINNGPLYSTFLPYFLETDNF